MAVQIPPTVAITPMGAADVAQVAALDAAAFSLPWPRQAFEAQLKSNPAAHFFVLRPLAEPQLLWGSAGYWLVAGEAHIATLAVDPRQRNRGFGKLLLQTMLADAQAHGGCNATLEVRASNLVAQHLYAAFGFELVGRRKNYYTDNHEDALLMTASSLGSVLPAQLGVHT